MAYKRQARDAVVKLIQKGIPFAEIRKKYPISQRTLSRWKRRPQFTSSVGRSRILNEVAIQYLLQTLLSGERDLERKALALNWKGIRERLPERSLARQTVIRLLTQLEIYPSRPPKYEIPNHSWKKDPKERAMMRKVYLLELCEWRLPSTISLPPAMSADSRHRFLWRFWGRRGDLYFVFSQHIPSNAAECLAATLQPIKATAFIVTDDLAEKLQIKEGLPQPIPIIKIPAAQNP